MRFILKINMNRICILHSQTKEILMRLDLRCKPMFYICKSRHGWKTY